MYLKRISALILAVIPFYLPSTVSAQWNENEWQKLIGVTLADSLVRDANACVLFQNLDMQVISKKKIQTKEVKITRLFNADANKSYVYQYDDLHKIDALQLLAYDANGDKIQQLSTREFTDRPNDDSYEHTHQRVKFANLNLQQFPVTVVEYIEKTQFESLNLPSFRPVSESKISILNAQFKLTIDGSFAIKSFVGNGITFDSAKQQHGIYAYYTTNQVAQQSKFNESQYSVNLAPQQFYYDGFEGSLASWPAFGNFFADLNQGLQDLPPILKTETDELLANAISKIDTIRALYHYLQDNYRYVSIQLGIGGYKPFSATEVYKNKFGDCKGLSNFMYSLLAAYNINSYYVLAYIGQRNSLLNMDTAINGFNHAMLLVPVFKDTVLLECTSNKLGAGYFSHSLNENLLIVNRNQSKLIQYKFPKGDTIFCKSKGEITKEGNMSCSSTIQYGGLSFSDVLALHTYSEEEFKKYINLRFRANEISQLVFNYNKYADNFPVEVKLDLKSSTRKMGKRFFVPYSQVSCLTCLPIGSGHRELVFIDSIVVDIRGAAMRVEFNPFPEHKIVSEYATFFSESRVSNNQLTILRTLIIHHRQRGQNVPDVQSFLQQLEKYENQSIVLVNVE
ncbi:MAG: transglutaminase family protein [Chitinophagaceae bacterium]|nr:transglutaminase family protein [Chitinophagaceae bacterium]